MMPIDLQQNHAEEAQQEHSEVDIPNEEEIKVEEEQQNANNQKAESLLNSLSSERVKQIMELFGDSGGTFEIVRMAHSNGYISRKVMQDFELGEFALHEQEIKVEEEVQEHPENVGQLLSEMDIIEHNKGLLNNLPFEIRKQIIQSFGRLKELTAILEQSYDEEYNKYIRESISGVELDMERTLNEQGINLQQLTSAVKKSVKFQYHLENVKQLSPEMHVLREEEAGEMHRCIVTLEKHFADLKKFDSKRGGLDYIAYWLNDKNTDEQRFIDSTNAISTTIAEFRKLYEKMLISLKKDEAMRQSVNSLCKNFQSIATSNKKLTHKVHNLENMLKEQARKIDEQNQEVIRKTSEQNQELKKEFKEMLRKEEQEIHAQHQENHEKC